MPGILAAGNDCFSSAEEAKNMRAAFILAPFLPARLRPDWKDTLAAYSLR
jgi:hypothetical protein